MAVKVLPLSEMLCKSSSLGMPKAVDHMTSEEFPTFNTPVCGSFHETCWRYIVAVKGARDAAQLVKCSCNMQKTLSSTHNLPYFIKYTWLILPLIPAWEDQKLKVIIASSRSAWNMQDPSITKTAAATVNTSTPGLSKCHPLTHSDS